MKKIFAVISFLLVSSCVTNDSRVSRPFSYDLYEITPVHNDFKLVKEEQVTEEMIEPGNQYSVRAGDVMYFYKVYNVRHYEKPIIKANMKGDIKGGLSPLEIKDGQVYEVMGTMNVDGVTYSVINPKNRKLLLIADDGKVAPYSATMMDEKEGLVNLLKKDLRVFPKDFKFVRDVERKKEVDNPFIGMEIIYKGKDKDQYKLIYKDYDGSGKEPYQTVNFTQDHEYVDFDNVKFQITTIDPSKLYYSVVAK